MTDDEFNSLPLLTAEAMCPGMLIATKNHHPNNNYTYSLLIRKLPRKASSWPNWQENDMWVELAIYETEGVCLDRTRADDLHTTHEGRIVGYSSAKVASYEV